MTSTDATVKGTSGSGSALPDAKHSVEGLLERVNRELQEGIHHGHFDFSISGTHARGDNIEVILRAGKNYRFLIPSR